MGVLAGPACAAVGVEVIDKPERGADRRHGAAQCPRDGDACPLVAMDTAHHQHSADRSRVADNEGADRSAENGMPEDE